MYFPSRKITGIIFIITLITKLQCTLDAAYSLVVPNDKVMPPALDAEHMPKQLGEFSIEAKVNESAVLKELNKDALWLPAALSQICAWIKDKKAETPECTALIREYQDKVLQQAMKDPAKKGDVDQIVSFMNAGGDVTQVDNNGYNALHQAAEKGHEAAVQFLIPLFAKSGLLESPGFFGETALHRAAQSNSVVCIKALLEAGANLLQTDNEGGNVLHYAAGYGGTTSALFLVPLVAPYGMLNAQLNNGKTPLQVAQASQYFNLATLLWIVGATIPMSEIELLFAIKSFINFIQKLPPAQFALLIEALGGLHKENIIVPGSFMAPLTPDQALFLPLRIAIAQRLSIIQREIRDSLQKSLPPELESLAERYLFGDVTPPLLLNSSSSSSSSSASSSGQHQ